MSRQIHEYEESLFKTTDELLKTHTEMELLKQKLKNKEEMLSLKDELISELRDRIELMKKLADKKGS